MSLSALVLIPARYGSSRFPGKPLAPLLNNTMISFVYERVEALKSVSGFKVKVAVVTDDSRIEEHLLSGKKNVVRVDDPVESGTERIQLAWERFFHQENFDFIVNVQGDEPLIEREDLVDLLTFHDRSPFDVTTIYEQKEMSEDFKNPNKVKAVVDEKSGKCFYFSRAAIPYDREGSELKNWNLHVGLYSYRPEALRTFCQNPVSTLENIEKLEQLRALSLGMSIGAVKARHPFMGVDLPEDIATVEGVLK